MTEAAELPPAPEEARAVFGEFFPEAVRYAELLADAGVKRGLIGPREVPRLWERHLLNCAVLSEVVPQGVTVCDVGSGAGLPGIPLALVRRDLKITLLEPLLRRTTFLQEAVELLGLDHVTVVRGRAEEVLGKVQPVHVVTARAVAPLDRLVELGRAPAASVRGDAGAQGRHRRRGAGVGQDRTGEARCGEDLGAARGRGSGGPVVDGGPGRGRREPRWGEVRGQAG